MPRTPRLAAIGGVAIVAALAGWLATRCLQQDFAAYYTAAVALSRGLDPYVNHLATPGGPWDGICVYRHSRFLYPPLVADLFRPLGALPFLWAKAIFTAGSVAALFWGLYLTRGETSVRVASPPGADVIAALGPLAMTMWAPVFVALERGQIDLLLFALLAAAWHWRNRIVVAGPLLATAAMGKPLVLGVLPILLFARRWRWAVATVGALVLLAGANVVVSGRALSEKYLREVLPRATVYGEGGPETWLIGDAAIESVGDDLAAGIARIDGRGRAYAQEIGTFRRNASLPRLLAGADVPSAALSLLLYVASGAVLALGARRSSTNAAWYWGGLIAGVVAAPVSWAMSLVWALPILALGLTTARPRPALAIALTVTFAAGMLGPLFAPAWVAAGLATVATAAIVTIGREATA